MISTLKTLLAIGLLLAVQGLSAQTATPLDDYLREAIRSSEGLKQQQFQLDKSLYALKEAKGLFLPSVGFGGSYSLAAGGRKINLPVGDLLNPVYATLNQLTQSNAFPQIQNTSEQLLPNNFYDAHIRVTQPLVNAEIYYNRKIKEKQPKLIEAEMAVYKRELVKNVRTAYFQYLQALEAIKIYDNALILLNENLRVNESLLKNGAGNPSPVARAKSEIEKVTAQREEANNNVKNAKAYFNFLLNRGFDEEILVDESYQTLPIGLPDGGTDNREELQKLSTARDLNLLALKLNKSYYLPKVGAQLDLGSQAFNFGWNGYLQFGLAVEVPIWQGNRNVNKIKQTELDIKTLQSQTEQVEDQIRLQVEVATNAYNSATTVYQSYASQVESTERYYKDTFKRYKEGQANYIELLDASTEITQARLQQSLSMYNIWIKLAELERATASFELNNN